MSKFKCKHCKIYFPADSYSAIKTNVGRFCCENHMICWAIADTRKKGKKRINTRKKAEHAKKVTYKKNQIKTRKRAAKEACHKYIRERDKGLLCICCNKPLGKNYHAGHFLESGNYSSIRYNEDNIHGQRLQCNYFKGGNGGDYRSNLIEKIGLVRVEFLESTKGVTTKRTADDYREIEAYYKDMLELLRVNRNESI